MELFAFLRLHAGAGNESAVEAALRSVIDSSREEPGCVSIYAFRSTEDARLFYIHSRWKDEAAFQRHAGLAHTVRFLASVDPLLDQPREVARTEIID